MSARTARDPCFDRRPPAPPRATAALAGLLAALAALAQPRPCAAQPSPSALAQARYDQGMRAFDARDYGAALGHFRAALDSTRSPNVRFMYARTLRALGRLDEALLELRLTAREASDRAATEPRFRATAQAAGRAVTELEPQLATLFVEVSPAGARVQLDERVLPPEALGVELPVLPGAHTLRVSAEGYVPQAQPFEASRGQVTRSRVALAAATQRTPPPPAVVAPPSVSEAPPPAQRNLGMMVAGASLLAVGVGGVVLAALYGPATLDAWSAVDQYCNASLQCEAGARAALRDGPTFEALAATGLGAAGAGLVLGGVLLGLGATPRAAVRPTVSLGGLGCAVRF